MELVNIPVLSLLIWLPILGGVWVLCIGDRQKEIARYFAFIIVLLTFALSVLLYCQFDHGLHGMQFVERSHWIPALAIYYHLGIDGISLPLVLLTTFISIFVVLCGWTTIKIKPSYYMAAFLILEGLMNGVFVALDGILFYVFWEAMLVPMFLIIGIWGGERRVYASIKFFLYTFLGSLFMLVALLYLYAQAGSFNILELHLFPLGMTEQKWIFVAFFLAFAVKIPMWPVHTWLPDAHVEAPTGGSVMLAAIMLKMGAYGFIRLSMPIVPDASLYFDDVMIVLSLIAIVYIGLVALAQSDMKKLIAYSSIAHMGFVTLGFFICFSVFSTTYSSSNAIMGMEGGLMQMLSHGLISAALFICVGVMYDRVHSREIGAYGGVVNTMPRFATLMMVFAMANAGLPGTSGFVGEFLVILSSFQSNFWVAFFAALTLVLGAAYTLWMYKRVIFGGINNEMINTLSDINGRETFMLVILAAAILLFGIWPAAIFEIMHASVENLAVHVLNGKL